MINTTYEDPENTTEKLEMENNRQARELAILADLLMQERINARFKIENLEHALANLATVLTSPGSISIKSTYTSNNINDTEALSHKTLNQVLRFIIKQAKWNRRLTETEDAIKSLIEVSGLIDRDWYLEINEDVKNAGSDPVTHYLKDGIFEDRAPSPIF